MSVFVLLGALVAQAVAAEDASSAGVPAIDPVLRRRLFSEGVEAWERTRKLYTSVECTGRRVSYGPGKAESQPTDVEHWHVKINGANQILETAETHLTPGDRQHSLADERDPGGSFQVLRVEGRNARYQFLFGRKTANSAWWISYAQRFDEPPRPHTRLQDSLDDYRIIMNVNTQVSMMPLPALFRDPHFTLKSLAPVACGDHPCVKAGFSYKPPVDKESEVPLRDGWLVFDPQYAWGTRAYEFVLWHPQVVWTVAGEIEYGLQDHIAGPVPVVRSISNRLYGSRGHIKTTLSRPIFRTIAPSEFQLATYGLPEPDEPDRPRSNLTFILSNAAAMLLGSVLLYVGYRVWSVHGGHERSRLMHGSFALVGFATLACFPVASWIGSGGGQPAASLHWESETFEHAEAGRPFKLSVILKNDSSTSFQVLGTRQSCGRTACLENGDKFPIEIPAKSQRSFEMKITPRRPGEFSVDAEFYTDLAAQFELSAVLRGKARAPDPTSKESASAR